MMRTCKRVACLSCVVLIAVLWTGILSAAPVTGNPESKQQASSVHVTAPNRLHQAVQAHSTNVAEARRHLTQFLNQPKVRSQVERIGIQPAQLQDRVGVLGDSEILSLQQQIMPLEEQLRTAGIGKNQVVVTLAIIITILTF